MTHASAEPQAVAEYRPKNKVRFVTAAALFDGHDAAINIMRRLLMSAGAEVIHLGHNRSVDEVVTAALQEDAQGIAISSYQGGHLEYFKYVIDSLRARGGEHIQVFGGGGGVIVPAEIAELQGYGVARIFSPEDGQRLGLQGMIGEMVRRCDTDPSVHAPRRLDDLAGHGDAAWRALARLITALENGKADAELVKALHARARTAKVPVLGVTGTGGAGKSSLTDELIRRLRLDQGDAFHVAVISIDPSRRRSGGALLGDRIRMNAIGPWSRGPRVYVRSLATRDNGSELSGALPEVLAAVKVAGFDLAIVETPGIGQGDAAIAPLVDVPIYVMTPEFGAASQLEKIDMLDFAELVAINKFDRKGALDALRDVAKQVQRNREAFGKRPEEMPVFGTIASRFNDDGVSALYQALKPRLRELGLPLGEGRLPAVRTRHSTHQHPLVPGTRVRYLAEIAETVRAYKRRAREQAALARELQQLRATRRMLLDARPPRPDAAEPIEALALAREARLDPGARRLLACWPEVRAAYAGDQLVVKIRDREVRTDLVHTTLSGSKIRKVALPRYEDDGELLAWLLLENVPGSFPYTAGTFPFKREGEDPTRMFAGEGDAFRTNRRFRLVSEGMPAKRLSTAFDSVTLYGYDPDVRPDIYGKVGNSGVSIATLDDLKVLYSGFDLCDPATSVSMTINGPAPAILAMFMNAAIDQRLERFAAEHGRAPSDAEAAELRAWALANVRGTVQADILKEDQGQNTCIFSTEFSLKVMGDIAEYFVQHQVRNFYSVSISGYHIAEAGANPISQLAFTLANGFTFVEAYLARGMRIDDFAPNLSFFFSNGMDPEYTVLGRVARRIWAVAMRERYGANERSQKLKYHVQTSGRSPARAGDRVQRHPHHAAGADRVLRQLQLAPHQRLRRGDHHAHRGERAARDGDPADHQPGVGPGEEREPAPGRLRHRRADRAGRGGGAGGIRADRRAGRRAGRDGDRLPARQDPGGEPALRDAEAHRRAAHHRRQHLPQPARRPGARAHRAGALHRGREALPARRACATSRPATPRRRRPCCERLRQAVIEDRQRLRGADGRGAGLLARADHRRAVRGGRPVPSQHVAQ